VHANEARAVVAATEVNAHLFWLLLFGREVFVEENLRLVWRERSNARHDAAVRFEKYILTRKTDYCTCAFHLEKRAEQSKRRKHAFTIQTAKIQQSSKSSGGKE
jgi:predicted nucleic acid-binding Zn finger protein